MSQKKALRRNSSHKNTHTHTQRQRETEAEKCLIPKPPPHTQRGVYNILVHTC